VTHEKKAQLLAAIGSRFARLLFVTLRFQLIDHAGVLAVPPRKPLLWAFWHNRLCVSAYMFERYFPDRPGAALASKSKDGEVIAAFVNCFGIQPIRGSSSRGGARALVEMKRAIDAGSIVAITPDGPRGPCYHLNPGVVKLAQITGGTVMPMHVEYSRCWRLKSWDGFMIPKPFAKVTITFDALHTVRPTANEAEFETERARLERALRRDGA